VSNPFAIAAVTTAFGQFLHQVTAEPTLAGTTVSTRPPDSARGTDGGRQLNLFLYLVSPNGAWRNMDLPSRRSNGELSGRPVLALDLHYLLTAYGQNDEELDAHHLLAHAMSLVHDQGVLTREHVRAAVAAQPTVAAADLADQVELVKLTPTALAVEEISKLWGTFPTTNYRLSVGYEASVVLIERRHPTRVATPVRAALVEVVPVRRPVIETVSPQIALPGDTLVIAGRNLDAGIVRVRFGTAVVTAAQVGEQEVRVALPAGLSAGVNTVQVLHELPLGDPPTPHRGSESNVVAFILAPRLEPPIPSSVARGAVMTLTFTPPVSRRQRVSALIGDAEIALPARAPGSPPAGALGFPVPGDFPTGTWLLRLRVDGAESPLVVDDDPVSPTYNRYVAPQVTVT
jgi:hypothetical protein